MKKKRKAKAVGALNEPAIKAALMKAVEYDFLRQTQAELQAFPYPKSYRELHAIGSILAFESRYRGQLFISRQLGWHLTLNGIGCVYADFDGSICFAGEAARPAIPAPASGRLACKLNINGQRYSLRYALLEYPADDLMPQLAARQIELAIEPENAKNAGPLYHFSLWRNHEIYSRACLFYLPPVKIKGASRYA